MGDRFLDWMFGGSVVGAIVKMMGVCAVPIGIIAIPFSYLADENKNALNDRLGALNGRPTKIFNSIADCKSKGYDIVLCEESQKKAIEIAEGLGTSMGYSSLSKCQKVHGLCSTETIMVSQPIMVNNIPLPNYIYITEHKPMMVAWQATNDLKIAVPLYNTPSNDVGIRNDGKLFELN